MVLHFLDGRCVQDFPSTPQGEGDRRPPRPAENRTRPRQRARSVHAATRALLRLRQATRRRRVNAGAAPRPATPTGSPRKEREPISGVGRRAAPSGQEPTGAVYPRGPDFHPAPGPQSSTAKRPLEWPTQNHLAQRVECFYPGGRAAPSSRKAGAQRNSTVSDPARSGRRLSLAAGDSESDRFPFPLPLPYCRVAAAFVAVKRAA